MAQRELLEAETIRQTGMGEIVHGDSVNVLAAYYQCRKAKTTTPVTET